jgi:hypothetical protein
MYMRMVLPVIELNMVRAVIGILPAALAGLRGGGRLRLCGDFMPAQRLMIRWVKIGRLSNL